jgi:flagellar biosynthesis anti-sigma factor FlgM
MAGIMISSVMQTYEAYSANKTVSSKKTEKPESRKDTVALSNQAKDFKSILKTLADVPDIRQDLVSGIKAKYDAGSYNVSSMETATKMVNKLAALD